jgi:CRISPR system Cascade subunit CasC
LRISSQALKRAWRESEVMQAALKGHMGQRTQRLGTLMEKHLIARGVPGTKAREAVLAVLPFFGKPKTEHNKALLTEQLAFISPEEMEAAYTLAERIAGGDAMPIKPDDLLRRTDTAADIAMFGRMLADNPDFNREAAVQVAHAITTHRALVEDDYYTAVDDLKTAAEDAGAGFVGEQGFGSGVFYVYLCVDLGLLLRNLGGKSALAGTVCAVLAEAAATIAPSGKQSSFAARARADFVLGERGDTQPRTLAGAFVPAVPERADVLAESIERLTAFRTLLDRAYGDTPEQMGMNVRAGEGSITEIATFCRQAALLCPAS